jgi:hypothetical protein
MHATFPANLILLDFIILMALVFVEGTILEAEGRGFDSL